MAIYVYKGGKKITVMGKTLLNRGDEVELDSLENINNANRLVPKDIWLKRYVKEKDKKEVKAAKKPKKKKPSITEKKPEKVEKEKPKKKK